MRLQTLRDIEIRTVDVNVRFGRFLLWHSQRVVQQFVDPVEGLGQRDERGRIGATGAAGGCGERLPAGGVALEPVAEVVGDGRRHRAQQRQALHVDEQHGDVLRMRVEVRGVEHR